MHVVLPIVGVLDEPFSAKPAEWSSHTSPPCYIGQKTNNNTENEKNDNTHKTWQREEMFMKLLKYSFKFRGRTPLCSISVSSMFFLKDIVTPYP